MEYYRVYLGLLVGAAGHVGWLLLCTALALCALVLFGLWLPLMLSSGQAAAIKGNSASRTPFDWTWAMPVALAAGMATSLTCWTLSLWLTGRMLPGGLMLVAACIAGLGLAWRQRGELKFRLSNPIVWSVATLFALLLGLWHHAGTEMPIAQDVPQLLFTDMHEDIAIHAHLAGMIRDGGLPLENLWGSRDYEYADLTHTGHAVLLAGLSTTLRISLYQASVALWIVATWLIAWATLALVADSRMPGWTRFVLVMATLVWGAFVFPHFYEFRDLKQAVADAQGHIENLVAARGYWNISQTLSIGLTLAGMLLLDRFAAARRDGNRAFLTLSAAAWFFVAGGWTKPSLVIFYGPALLIWLLLNRGNLREWACVLLILSAGLLVHMLPALVASLPQHASWSHVRDAAQWILVGKFACVAAASLLVLAADPLRRLFVESWRDGSWRITDLALVAMGGCLLFSALFREDRYVGFHAFQPNLWWGPAACVVLLVPLLAREGWAALGGPGWRRGVAVVGLLMATVQIVNGACFAIAYPVLNLRNVAQPLAETLKAARERTPPGSRFAVDPVLHHFDLMCYLARPVLLASSFTPEKDIADHFRWQSFCAEGGQPDARLIDRFDAVVILTERQHVRIFLTQHGWRGEALNPYFELWRPSADPPPE